VRGFPNEEAALKLLFLALRQAAKKWTMPIHHWREALNHFTILWPDRMPWTGWRHEARKILRHRRAREEALPLPSRTHHFALFLRVPDTISPLFQPSVFSQTAMIETGGMPYSNRAGDTFGVLSVQLRGSETSQTVGTPSRFIHQ
jgi:hypothetical protein